MASTQEVELKGFDVRFICIYMYVQLNVLYLLPASEDSARPVGADAHYVIKVVSGANTNPQ